MEWMIEDHAELLRRHGYEIIAAEPLARAVDWGRGRSFAAVWVAARKRVGELTVEVQLQRWSSGKASGFHAVARLTGAGISGEGMFTRDDSIHWLAAVFFSLLTLGLFGVVALLTAIQRRYIDKLRKLDELEVSSAVRFTLEGRDLDDARAAFPPERQQALARLDFAGCAAVCDGALTLEISIFDDAAESMLRLVAAVDAMLPARAVPVVVSQYVPPPFVPGIPASDERAELLRKHGYEVVESEPLVVDRGRDAAYGRTVVAGRKHIGGIAIEVQLQWFNPWRRHAVARLTGFSFAGAGTFSPVPLVNSPILFLIFTLLTAGVFMLIQLWKTIDLRLLRKVKRFDELRSPELGDYQVEGLRLENARAAFPTSRQQLLATLQFPGAAIVRDGHLTLDVRSDRGDSEAVLAQVLLAADALASEAVG